MQHLFNNPRNHWQVEQAVISMLAGDVFDNRAVLRRLRLFRTIYALTALRMAPLALRGWLQRRRAGARRDRRRHPAGGESVSAVRMPGPVAARLRVDYVHADGGAALAAALARDDTLAVFGFGAAAPRQRRPALAARAARTGGRRRSWKSGAAAAR